jgi:hypothetical protein
MADRLNKTAPRGERGIFYIAAGILPAARKELFSHPRRSFSNTPVGRRRSARAAIVNWAALPIRAVDFQKRGARFHLRGGQGEDGRFTNFSADCIWNRLTHCLPACFHGRKDAEEFPNPNWQEMAATSQPVFF